MYDRVLHPIDGSEGSEVATEHAVELAQRLGVSIHALYVIDVRGIQAADAYDATPPTGVLEALETEGEVQIEQVRDRAQESGVTVSSTITEGAPARTIVDTADPDDVIVMGTHGRTGLDRYLIGSTTEKVIRTADVPVVSVPVAEVEEPEER